MSPIKWKERSMQDVVQEDTSNTGGLAASGMLVEVRISEWNGQVKDLNVRDKVSSDNNANRSRLQVTKKLFGKGSLLHQINTLSSQIRAYKNDNTLQWVQSVGLLPATNFYNFNTEIHALVDRWRGLVDKLCTGWDAQLQQIQQDNELGALHNPDDYPTAEELKRKFSIFINFMPVPTGDWRVQVQADELRELKSHYQAVIEQKTADVNREAWNKAYKVVRGMADKLHSEDVKRWHSSFVTNAKDMCEMLTHLNVTKDPELERARRDLENAMMGIEDIDDIKENDAKRDALRKKLDTMLSVYDW